MDTDDSCCICYKEFKMGKKPRDGPSNSDVYGSRGQDCECKHYFCVDCLQILYYREEYKCPLCRFDWSEWMLRNYPVEDFYLSSGDEEEEE